MPLAATIAALVLGPEAPARSGLDGRGSLLVAPWSRSRRRVAPRPPPSGRPGSSAIAAPAGGRVLSVAGGDRHGRDRRGQPAGGH